MNLNDAEILKTLLQDPKGLRKVVRENDVMVLDRGFQDGRNELEFQKNVRGEGAHRNQALQMIGAKGLTKKWRLKSLKKIRDSNYGNKLHCFFRCNKIRLHPLEKFPNTYLTHKCL